MYPDTPSVSQLAHVISQAAAPAFLPGALAAFIAVLINRLKRIVDRTAILNGIPDEDSVRRPLKADLPRLMWRAAMINRAIFWAVIASIAVTLLVIVAFITAFLQLQHEHGVAIFFLISLGAWDVRRFPLIYVGKQTFSASGGLSQSFQQRTDAMPRW